MKKLRDNPNLNPGLEQAIVAAGGVNQLARKLTMHTGRFVVMQNIDRWRKTNLPPVHCPAIEAVTGIKCETLRPDVEFVRKQKKVVGYIVEI